MKNNFHVFIAILIFGYSLPSQARTGSNNLNKPIASPTEQWDCLIESLKQKEIDIPLKILITELRYSTQDRELKSEKKSLEVRSSIVTPSCTTDIENILQVLENEKDAIQKIRNAYAEIEQNKSSYTRYELFQNEEGVHFLVNPNEFEFDDEGGQIFMVHQNQFYTAHRPVFFYFDATDQLVHVEEIEGSSIAVQSGGSASHKYYFSSGAHYPFFIYSYSDSYFINFQYQEDPELIYQEEKFQEYRIYNEITSTLGQECPKTIRGLMKQLTVEEIIPSEDYTGNHKTHFYRQKLNSQPNQKMTREKLFELCQLFIFKNDIMELSKSRKLKVN